MEVGSSSLKLMSCHSPIQRYSKPSMAPDASGLHCPNCGAAAEPEAGRCPYCQARLATVSCPSCFALGFDGAAFCHKCGAARVRRAGGRRGRDVPGVPERAAAGGRRRDAVSGMRSVRRGLGRRRRVRAAVRAAGVAGGGACSAWRRDAPATGRGTRALPAVPPLRQDDEPRQLRQAIRSGDRRLPRARHLPRRRRAASDRHVHPGWRSRPRAGAASSRSCAKESGGCRRSSERPRSTGVPMAGRPWDVAAEGATDLGSLIDLITDALT